MEFWGFGRMLVVVRAWTSVGLCVCMFVRWLRAPTPLAPNMIGVIVIPRLFVGVMVVLCLR